MKTVKELEDEILQVWGKHNEFKDCGNRYVTFVLQKQIDEIVEKGFTQETMDKEISDMIIIGLRYFSRRGKHTEDLIESRLSARHEGKTDEIKAKYLKMYEHYMFPLEGRQ